jgi:hypothetical protein
MLNNPIPDRTLKALQGWIDHGRPLGGFCRAVVENDLKLACARADEFNLPALPDIVAWMYCHAPEKSWGSPKATEEWPRILAAQGKP